MELCQVDEPQQRYSGLSRFKSSLTNRTYYWLTSITGFFIGLLLLTSNAYAQVQSIQEFSKGMLKVEGYYTFYYDKQADKLYLQVDKFEQPFLFQSSLPNGLGSNDIGLDRGQLGATRIVQFENYGNKVLLTQLNTDYRANSRNNAERKSVEQAFAKSVIEGFEIKAKDRGTVLIDYTPFLLSDIHGISERLKDTKQGNFKLVPHRSAVHFARSKAFEKNTELEAIISFSGSKPGKYVRQVAPDPERITLHTHHSLIELPDNNYKPRVFHPFSGFWSISHKDYAVSLDESMDIKVIPRHRLEKKNPKADKSEAKEPIVYYLDPGTPEPVRSALLEGARWWNQAFEAAGFINAFQVKMLPEHADPMDVRYNTIQWVHRATRGWSYGASVIDPRTGEIIKGHVTLGSLRVRHDYLLAQALTGPFESGTETPLSEQTTAIKEMALARIRQLSAHEVGHTLGIAHNFAASTNDRASVMDYPHPLITLNDGTIDLSNAYATGIGEWDKHVVKYGYSQYTSASKEQAALKEIIGQAQSQGLLYMSDPDARPLSGAHPTGHLWDNGKDAAAELTRVLTVRAHALNDFGLNNLAPNQPLSDLAEILMPLYYFHRYQVTAAVKQIGGIEYSYALKEDVEGTAIAPVSAKQQQAALEALLQSVSSETLTLPQSVSKLIPPKAYGSYANRETPKSKTGLTFDPITLAAAGANHTLTGLLNPARLSRIAQQSAQSSEFWTLNDYLTQIVEATVKPSLRGAQESLVQQRIAAVTVEKLVAILSDEKTPIEVKADLFNVLAQLNAWLKQETTNPSTGYRGFYRVLSHHLDWYFDHRKWIPLTDMTKLPPGSPI